MKFNKTTVIPLVILIFTLLGLEIQVLPYIPFGNGRWIDSVSKNTSNRSIEVRGDMNITGSYKVNGVTIGAGTPITASEEGGEVEDNITGLNFAGNLFTATTSSGTVSLTMNVDSNDFFTRYNLDTNDIALQSEGAGFDGEVAAASFSTSGSVTCDALSVVGGLPSTIAGLLTVEDSTGFQDDVTIAGFTQLGSSAPAVRQKLIKGLSATGNSTVTFAHGLDFYKIIGSTITLRNDTAGTNAYFTAPKWIIPPQASFMTEVLYYAGLDGTYCWARFPAGSVSTRGDSLFFLITYIE